MKELYAGIDLHSTNSLVVQDEEDAMVFRRRLPNVMEVVLEKLEPYRERLVGVAVESTYNWYWLVDGLMDTGYRVHLANPAAMRQYEGLKHGDDESDARWLAQLLRLGILPQGYIYPKEARPVRDLFRKRAQLVRHHTANVLSVQNLITRNTGTRVNVNAVKKLDEETVDRLLPTPERALAVKSNIAVMRTLREQIRIVEKAVKGRVRLREEFKAVAHKLARACYYVLRDQVPFDEVRAFG